LIKLGKTNKQKKKIRKKTQIIWVSSNVNSKLNFQESSSELEVHSQHCECGWIQLITMKLFVIQSLLLESFQKSAVKRPVCATSSLSYRPVQQQQCQCHSVALVENSVRLTSPHSLRKYESLDKIRESRNSIPWSINLHTASTQSLQHTFNRATMKPNQKWKEQENKTTTTTTKKTWPWITRSQNHH